MGCYLPHVIGDPINCKPHVILDYPKKILSEDDCDILNRKLQYIRPGMIITVIYYDKGQYIQLEGKVSKINLDTKILQIVKTKINLKSVVDIIGKDIEEEYL